MKQNSNEGLGHFNFTIFMKAMKLFSIKENFPTFSPPIVNCNITIAENQNQNVELLTEDVTYQSLKMHKPNQLMMVIWFAFLLQLDGKIDIKAQISDEVKPGISARLFISRKSWLTIYI